MICRVLPNRQICLVMTPREASMLEGQILDPGEFPWQDSETHVVAAEARVMLKRMVEQITEHELGNAISAITATAEHEEMKQHMEKQEAAPDGPYDQEKDESTP